VHRSFELFWHADTIAAIATQSNGHIPTCYNRRGVSAVQCWRAH